MEQDKQIERARLWSWFCSAEEKTKRKVIKLLKEKETKMTKEIIKGLLAIIIVGATIVALFIESVDTVTINALIGISGAILGYYYGIKDIPLGKVIRGK